MLTECGRPGQPAGSPGGGWPGFTAKPGHRRDRPALERVSFAASVSSTNGTSAAPTVSIGVVTTPAAVRVVYNQGSETNATTSSSGSLVDAALSEVGRRFFRQTVGEWWPSSPDRRQVRQA